MHIKKFLVSWTDKSGAKQSGTVYAADKLSACNSLKYANSECSSECFQVEAHEQ